MCVCVIQAVWYICGSLCTSVHNCVKNKLSGSPDFAQAPRRISSRGNYEVGDVCGCAMWEWWEHEYRTIQHLLISDVMRCACLMISISSLLIALWMHPIASTWCRVLFGWLADGHCVWCNEWWDELWEDTHSTLLSLSVSSPDGPTVCVTQVANNHVSYE